MIFLIAIIANNLAILFEDYGWYSTIDVFFLESFATVDPNTTQPSDSGSPARLLYEKYRILATTTTTNTTTAPKSNTTSTTKANTTVSVTPTKTNLTLLNITNNSNGTNSTDIFVSQKYYNYRWWIFLGICLNVILAVLIERFFISWIDKKTDIKERKDKKDKLEKLTKELELQYRAIL